MTRKAQAWIVSAVLVVSGSGWAQMGGAGQGTAGQAGAGQTSGAQALPRSLSGQQEVQLEGQLVDLFTISQRSNSGASNSNMNGTSSSGGTAVASEPGLRIERATPSAGGTAIPPAGGATANTGAMQTSTSGGVSAHVGDSSGTYNNPGAVGGAGDTSAAIGGNSRVGNTTSGLTPGNAGVGGTAGGTTVGGTASGGRVNTGAVAAGGDAAASSTDIRANLATGIPAALSAGGQTYVLVCEPRQLSQIAGNNVRVSGRMTGNNLLIPSRIEVRDAGGIYREVALSMPASSGRVGTASER